MKRTEKLLKLIADSDICEYCNNKVYLITTKKRKHLEVNPDGSLHEKSCRVRR